MTRMSIVLSGFLAFAGWSTAADPDEPTLVVLDSYASKAPADWIKQKPANRLRKYEFHIEPVEGEAHSSEISILPNFGGSTESKHTRWKADIIPPSGKTIDEVSTVRKFTVADKLEAVSLDVTGTWVFKERPFDPKSKPEQRPDYRVIWVILNTDRDSYQIRFAGPQQTVEKHKKAFDEWLNGFTKVEKK